MWVKVNGWIKLPDNAEIHQERSSSKRAWQDWSQRGWWSADSGTTTQEGDRTTTQEGDRTAQQEGTTTQEDSDDGYQPQQKKKHQKMDYEEMYARDSTSSWWDWQQHGEWPGWQQWQDRGQSYTDLHAGLNPGLRQFLPSTHLCRRKRWRQCWILQHLVWRICSWLLLRVHLHLTILQIWFFRLLLRVHVHLTILQIWFFHQTVALLILRFHALQRLLLSRVSRVHSPSHSLSRPPPRAVVCTAKSPGRRKDRNSRSGGGSQGSKSIELCSNKQLQFTIICAVLQNCSSSAQ